MSKPRMTRDKAREAALDHAVKMLQPHFQNVCILVSDLDLDDEGKSDDGMCTRMGCRMAGDIAAVYGLTQIANNMAGGRIQALMEADDDDDATDDDSVG